MGVNYNPRTITDDCVFHIDMANPKCYAGNGLGIKTKFVELTPNPVGTGNPFITGTAAPTQGQIKLTKTSISTCAAKKSDSACPAENVKTSDAENITTTIDTSGFSF